MNTLTPSTAQQANARVYQPWLSVIRYAFFGGLILFVASYAIVPHPSQKEVRTDGTVVRYVTAPSSTEAFSPVIAYQDTLGEKHEEILSASSDQYPLAVGKTVVLYYQKQHPSSFFLADDPYLRWIQLIVACFSAPFFLLSVLFLALILFRVPRERIAWVAKIVPFLVPFITFPIAVAAMRLFHVDVPGGLSWNGPSMEADTAKGDSPFPIIATILALGLFALWAMPWPIMMALQSLGWIRKQRQEAKSDEAIVHVGPNTPQT